MTLSEQQIRFFDVFGYLSFPGLMADRIEADPRGGLTVSCKAVGRDVNAFRWDSLVGGIVYEPRESDELAVPIADVVYVNA